ncbi:putative ubiquitin-like putative cysteine protease [Feldmannia species virus]|uniref:Putative ubiquitin-like putative cysteine protease n=1 Tax=Feldmannia species virus TaxID=39420 RepID=B5LWM9_9PHYC|nr:putative ubiquitin-like putative cysteine protease [Feldmannia species virus]ACH46892.1 putative ubiquitin-like putative cysteine protease [Feldmannia species virus]
MSSIKCRCVSKYFRDRLESDVSDGSSSAEDSDDSFDMNEFDWSGYSYVPPGVPAMAAPPGPGVPAMAAPPGPGVPAMAAAAVNFTSGENTYSDYDSDEPGDPTMVLSPNAMQSDDVDIDDEFTGVPGAGISAQDTMQGEDINPYDDIDDEFTGVPGAAGVTSRATFSDVQNTGNPPIIEIGDSSSDGDHMDDLDIAANVEDTRDALTLFSSNVENRFGPVRKTYHFNQNDIDAVRVKGWFNEKIIGDAMAQLGNGSDPDIPLGNFTADVYLYRLLQSGGRSPKYTHALQRHVFHNTIRKLIFPVHVRGNHWVLVEVDFDDRSITCYNSSGRDDKVNDSIFRTVYWWIYDSVGIEMNRIVGDCPSQGNNYDCGPCVCLNAAFLSQNIELTKESYGPEHIASFRQFILERMLEATKLAQV